MKWRWLVLALSFAVSGSYGQTPGQQSSLQRQQIQDHPFSELAVHFRSGSSVVDLDYMGNRIALSRIAAACAYEKAQYITQLRIEGNASPEGVTHLNERLAWERAEAVKRYIMTYYPYISPAKIVAVGMGENWAGLRSLVEADYYTPRRESVLYIIDNVHAHIDYRTNISRKKSLMDLGTPTWNYLLKHHIPLLRTGGSMLITIDPNTPQEIVRAIDNTLRGVETPPPAAETPVKRVVVEQRIDTVFIQQRTDTVVVEQFVAAPVVKEESLERKPLFAIKTNLLFDVASALNLEMEIPIGPRFSLAAEMIFPWWLLEKKQYCLQTLGANLEARYWLGNRTNRPQMTGWFVGLYAGAGYYDLEWDKTGYQGEYLIPAGLSGGYAHTIGTNFRMEYALGIGYLSTDYKEYESQPGIDGNWHLILQRRGTQTWFGPTRAKVSLVWMIHYGNQNKRVSR